MSCTNVFFAIAFCCTIALTTPECRIFGADYTTDLLENYIDGNTNKIARFDIPVVPDDGSGWTNCNCCPQNHVTQHSSLPYDHFHMSAIPFDADAFDSNGLPFKLSADSIDQYYDILYGYPSAPGADIEITKEGNVNTSQNCHSYVLGLTNLWVNDGGAGVGEIYLDDFNVVGEYDAPAVGDVGARPNSSSATHSWKVTAVNVVGSGGPLRITQTKEKFRCSKIYVSTYKNNTFVSVSSELLRKK